MVADVMPFGPARDANALLSRLFGTKPDDYRIVLFRLNPARSVSFTAIAAACADAAGQPDVYVHVGLTRRSFSGGDRPEAAEIDALGGLWADIDIADPVHKKPGLPPDQDAALRIIDAMGLVPGLVVHSGHGLQCWWPFSEVVTFDDDKERRAWRILARAWALTLKERARALGYTVDMVSDISRVLRVPGTQNGKDPARVVPVTILRQSKATIGEDDVLRILLDGTYDQAEREIDGKRGNGDQIVYGDLTLDPQAEPPWTKLDLLRDLEPRFDQAWRRKQTRRTEGWSASEWDQSLAAYAAQADWTRQEIANLLISARRRHGDDLKLRQDYYGATISKATAGREDAEAVREAVAVASGLSQTPPDQQSNTEHTDVLSAVSKSIRIEITRVTRSKSDPPSFGVETPFGSGSLGGVEAIVSNRKFRLKMAELTNRIPRKLKDDDWEPIAQALLQVAEIEDLGVEATLAGRAETLVSLYLGNQPKQAVAEMSDKTVGLLPVRLEPFIGDDGATRIFASGFRQWLAEHQHDAMNGNQVAELLAAIGATPETHHYKVDGRRTTRSLWKLARPGEESAPGYATT
jgi:hypothetical protein